MDVHTKAQRSFNMSRIRSKWTKPEKIVHAILKRLKIKHKMHPKIKGSPDLILPETKTAVFIHGCFWHKCPKHFIQPKSNRKYWLKKIRGNNKQDENSAKNLRKKGYRVIRIWEHEVLHE